MNSNLNLVVSKSRRYLRISTLLLTAAAVLCSGMAMYLQWQEQIHSQDFEANSNIHVISITNRVGGDSGQIIESLDVKDVTNIRELVAKSDSQAVVSPKWALGVGIPVEPLSSGNSVTIIGLDSSVGDLIGVTQLANDVGYTLGGTGDLKLQIPVVNSMSSAGAESDKLTPYTLRRSATLNESKVQYLQRGNLSELVYVSSPTFWNVAERMFELPQAQIEQAYTRGELPLTTLVSAIYVVVPDVQMVRAQARSLNQAGYDLNYALQAFDEVEKSLRIQQILGGALSALTLIGVGAYFLLSWQSYMRLSRRDIGILKHWQIAPATINRLYDGRLLRSIGIPAAASVLVVWVASLALFGFGSGVRHALINTFAVAVIGILLYSSISRFVIKPWVDREVLTLLKSDREFQ